MVGTILIWFQGFLLGIAVAAPVGPIGLLCIRRTLERGQWAGLATGLGAAVADTILGAIAAFGITAALVFLAGHEVQFRLFGGAFLLIVAARTWLAPAPVISDALPDARTCFGGFIIGLSLTLTNPITMLGFVGLFAGIGLGAARGPGEALMLVTGVFFGSAAWWLTLSTGVAMVRHKLSSESLRRINRSTAILLASIGVWALGSLTAWLF